MPMPDTLHRQPGRRHEVHIEGIDSESASAVALPAEGYTTANRQSVYATYRWSRRWSRRWAVLDRLRAKRNTGFVTLIASNVGDRGLGRGRGRGRVVLIDDGGGMVRLNGWLGPDGPVYLSLLGALSADNLVFPSVAAARLSTGLYVRQPAVQEFSASQLCTARIRPHSPSLHRS
ncbi:hypothetical protein NUW58_g1828 [Xylaria curta]|uniref:Uncharacterized protein n=1 Tax=Xylaria curta TaxID=42375 RepID=A0ACC1PJM6_9PEZI|nr:hypothetical protein NUW58_g1828 [Xylaria curta]